MEQFQETVHAIGLDTKHNVWKYHIQFPYEGKVHDRWVPLDGITKPFMKIRFDVELKRLFESARSKKPNHSGQTQGFGPDWKAIGLDTKNNAVEYHVQSALEGNVAEWVPSDEIPEPCLRIRWEDELEKLLERVAATQLKNPPETPSTSSSKREPQRQEQELIGGHPLKLPIQPRGTGPFAASPVGESPSAAGGNHLVVLVDTVKSEIMSDGQEEEMEVDNRSPASEEGDGGSDCEVQARGRNRKVSSDEPPLELFSGDEEPPQLSPIQDLLDAREVSSGGDEEEMVMPILDYYGPVYENIDGTGDKPSPPVDMDSERDVTVHHESRRSIIGNETPSTTASEDVQIEPSASSCNRVALKLLMCPFCLKVFLDHVKGMRHLHMHTKEKPYFCLECSNEFSSKGTLTDHTRSIHPVARYRCILCVKEFSDFATLNSHYCCPSNFTRQIL